MRYRPAPPRSVASRITAILSTFLTGESHSITEIAHMTGLPISTTHRITADLAAWQLLQRASDGRYGVGSILQRLGGVGVATPELMEWAPGAVLDLCAATGMRARFAVLDEGRIVYIEKRPGPEPITSFSAGATLPAHASAAGKAILAFAPSATVCGVAQNLTAFTPRTVNTPDRLRRALEIARLARTAVARAELSPGQSDVAVPVFGCGGVAVAALELEVRNLATELEVARVALAVAARGLSRQLTVDPAVPAGRRQLRLAQVPLGGAAAGA
jgi:DNA-binding IclR family transcriptional regulator